MSQGKAHPSEETPKTIRDRFVSFSKAISAAVGSVWAFVFSVFVVIVWACLGPVFQYSDTWQLVINTSTTIVTFLMVFLIQSTQNRDAKAIHLKLDELIRATVGARNDLVDLEELSEDELEHLAKEFSHFRDKARATIDRRRKRGRKPAGHETVAPASPPETGGS
jgi:low affinity Fe/Cu permease